MRRLRRPPRAALGAVVVAIGAACLTGCAPGLSKPISALVTATRNAILAQGSVHIDIEGFKKGQHTATDSVVGDIGLTSVTEHITESAATVTIRVTPAAAYFEGNKKGLTTIAGLTAAEAARVGKHWVELKQGSSQYKAFSSGASLSGLASSLLPTGSSAVKLTSVVLKGTKVKELSWTATASGSSEHFTQELFLSSARGPLPIEEISIGQSDNQTGSFAAWGEHFTVPAPPAADVIGFSALTKG